MASRKSLVTLSALPALHALAAAAALAVAPAAKAQSTAAAGSQTIVVSAQRRIEEVQQVPIAITAITPEDLQMKQIRRLDDLKLEVPNVVIEPNTGTSSGAKIFMRGVGTDESLFTADPSVAIYVDDTYIARQTGALFDMFDLQRVEVLRGPQGTLYGRNATGGAVRYITKKPGGESRLDIDARIGNHGRLDTQISGSARLGDSAGINYGLMSKNRDGVLTDLTNGGKVNDEQVFGARAGLALELSKSTSLRLSLDALKQTSGPVFASGVIDAAAAARFNRPVNNADGNLDTIETNLPGGINNLDQGGIAIATATDLGAVEWRNIVSWRQMNNELWGDFDGSTRTAFHLYQDQKQKQTQLETQLVSTGSGPLTWTAGLFWFNERNTQPTRQDIFAPGGVNTVRQDTVATAVYGQGDYRFNPVWKATFGLRYSHESKDFGIDALRANGTPNFSFAAKNSWSRTDYKLGLDAQLSKTLMFYGSLTTGFKSGGFNGRAATAAAAALVLKPETVKTIELGIKSTLLDGAARLNVALFQNDYRDLQLTAFNSVGASVLFNAASATIKGVEIDASAEIVRGWNVSLNLGTLDGKYKDFSEANRPIFDGKKLKQAPELQYALSTSWRSAVAGGSMVLGASLRFVDDHYQNLANSEIIKTSAYTLYDARLAYEAQGNRWSVALWGKNLADKRYYAGGFDISGLGVAVAYLNPPRSYGLDFRYRFW